MATTLGAQLTIIFNNRLKNKLLFFLLPDLLRQLAHQNKDEVWQLIKPYLMLGIELKAQYAFEDLWKKVHD